MTSRARYVRVAALALLVVLAAPRVARGHACGDSDDSGGITVTDGVNVLRQAAGLSSACGGALARCDVDGNGSVTVTDGVNVLRSAAGLGASLSCPGEDDEDVGRFAGRYEGTYSGDDRGTFDVDVDCEGEVDGSAYSDFYDEEYGVRGTVTPDGRVAFTIGTVEGGASFTGALDENGHLDGQWNNRFEDASGTFKGNRTDPQTCR